MLRYDLKFPLLRTLYYVLFDSHLRHGCQIWGQKQSPTVETIEQTQNKACYEYWTSKVHKLDLTTYNYIYKEIIICQKVSVIFSLLILNCINTALKIMAGQQSLTIVTGILTSKKLYLSGHHDRVLARKLRLLMLFWN